MKAFVSMFLTSFIFMGTLSANYQFGSNGRDGEMGRWGARGKSGGYRVVFADGKAMSLILRGEDGENGGNGQPGDSAWNCNQPMGVAYNIYGAHGGKGGNAGNGGDGGHGGNVDIYYQDLQNLRTIFVDAEGGRGGRSGYPANGGIGCRCYRYEWKVTQCHTEKGPDGKPVEICREYTYFCRDGENGTDGDFARDGKRGQLGSVRLIKSKQGLEKEEPSVSLKLNEALSKTHTLSRHLWAEKTGILSLLAHGSRVHDNFVEYRGTHRGHVMFKWENSRNPKEFSDSKFNVYLDHNGLSYQVDAPPNYWLRLSEEGTDLEKVVSVSLALKEPEVRALKLQGIRGDGSGLQAVIVDEALVSDVIDTELHLTYKTDGYLTNPTRFKGVVPRQFVRYENGKFVIDIGKLSIDPKYLSKGNNIIMDWVIKRKLDEKELSFELSLKTKI